MRGAQGASEDGAGQASARPAPAARSRPLAGAAGGGKVEPFSESPYGGPRQALPRKKKDRAVSAAPAAGPRPSYFSASRTMQKGLERSTGKQQLEDDRKQREEVEQHMLEGVDSDDEGGNSEDEGEVDLKELYQLATQEKEEILPRELRSVFRPEGEEGEDADSCCFGCGSSSADHGVRAQALCECLLLSAGSERWAEDGLAASAALHRQLSRGIALCPEGMLDNSAAVSAIGRSFFAALTTAETVFRHAKGAQGPLRQGWRFIRKRMPSKTETHNEGPGSDWDSDSDSDGTVEGHQTAEGEVGDVLGDLEPAAREKHPDVATEAEREAHWMTLLAFAKLMVPVFRSTGLVHASLSDFTVVALCAVLAHTGAAKEMAEFGRDVRSLKNMSVNEYEAGLCELRRSPAYRHFTKQITEVALSETPFMNLHARMLIKRSVRKVLFLMMGIGLVTSLIQFAVLVAETRNTVTGRLVVDVLILSLFLTVPGLLSLSIIANVLKKPSNVLVTVMLHLRFSVLTKARFVRAHGAISSKQDLVRTSSYLLNLVTTNAEGLSKVAQLTVGDKGSEIFSKAEGHLGRVQEKLDSLWEDPEMGRPVRGVSMIQRRYAEASFFRRSLLRSTTISSVLMYLTVTAGIVAQSLLHFRVHKSNNCRPQDPRTCSEHLEILTLVKYGVVPFVTFPVSAMCTMFAPLLFCKAYLAFAVCAHRLNTDILAQMTFATLTPADSATIAAEHARTDPTPTPKAFAIVSRHRASLQRSYMRAKRLTNMLNSELHGLIATWVGLAVAFWAVICILIYTGDKRGELLFAVALLPTLVTWMLICVSSANPNLDNINSSTDRQRNRDVAAGRGLGYMPNTMVKGHTVPQGDALHWSDAFQTLVRTSPLGIELFGFKLSPKAVAAQAYSAFTLSVTVFASSLGLI